MTKVQIGNATLYHGDARLVLPSLPRADLLLTDPPYGLGDRLTGGHEGEWSVNFEVSPDWDGEPVPLWLILQAIDHASHAVIWGGNYYALPPQRGWLTWDKMQEHTSGHCELAWTTLDIPTRTYRKSRVEAYGKGKQHPTEKPLGLMEWCLSLADSAVSTVTVLDPFMGSGTTGVACVNHGRAFFGIERDQKYFRVACERIKAAHSQQRLFA